MDPNQPENQQQPPNTSQANPFANMPPEQLAALQAQMEAAMRGNAQRGEMSQSAGLVSRWSPEVIQANLQAALADAERKRSARLTIEELEKNIGVLKGQIDSEQIDRQRGQEALNYYIMLYEIASASGVTKETEAYLRDNPNATREQLKRIIDRDDTQQRFRVNGVDDTSVRMERIESVVQKFLNLRSSSISLQAEWMLQGIADFSINREAIATNMYGFAAEYAIERELTDALDVNPYEEIKLTGPQQSNMQFLIGQVALAEKLVDQSNPFYRYLNELLPVRLAAHEIFRNARIDQGHFTQAIAQHLRRNGINFLENEIAGVKEARAIGEKVFAKKVAENPHWIPDQELNKAYNEVGAMMRMYQNRLRAAQNAGTLHGVAPLQHQFKVNVGGSEGQLTVKRDLREFQLQRAQRVGGTILPTMTLRTNIYGVLKEISGRYEKQLRSYVGHQSAIAAKKIAFEKFLRGNTTGSAEYIDLFYGAEGEYAEGRGEYYGIWYQLNADGSISLLDQAVTKKDHDAYVKKYEGTADIQYFTPYESGYIGWHDNDTGVLDPQSQGWRVRELLSGNPLLDVYVDPSNMLKEGSKRVTFETWADDLGGIGLKELGVEDPTGRFKKLSDLKDPEDVKAYYLLWYDKTRAAMKAKGDMDEFNRLGRDNEDYLTDQKMFLFKFPDRMKNIIRSHAAREVLLSRRFNVGGIIQEGWLTPTMKEELWKNVARTLPTRMVAMMGEKIREEVMINALSRRGIISGRTAADKKKAYDAYTKRMNDMYAQVIAEEKSARHLSELSTERETEIRHLVAKANGFLDWNILVDKLRWIEQARLAHDVEVVEERLHHGQGDWRARVRATELVQYYNAFDVSPDERLAIESLIFKGQQMTPAFARTVMPFNQFLDDVAENNWGEFGDEDLMRILVGDHKVLKESYDALGNLLTNPTIPPADFAKTMEGWAKGFGSVFGTEGIGRWVAQAQVEKAAVAHIRFAEKKKISRRFAGMVGEGMALFKQARSIAEEHNLASKMAYDAEDINGLIDLLASKELISDNEHNLDAFYVKQTDRLKKKLGADILRLILEQYYILQYLLPAAFLDNYIKAVLPEDVVKALK